MAKKIDTDISRNKIELSKEEGSVMRYDIINGLYFQTDTIHYLSDEFISEVAVREKNLEINYKYLNIATIDNLINEYENKLNNETYLNELIKANNNDGIKIDDLESFKEEVNAHLKKEIEDLKKAKEENNFKIKTELNELSEQEKKEAKDKIIEIMTLIEQVKLEVIEHLESNEYLEKLEQEMNLSRKLAKLHQKVRINNVKNISYNLKHKSEIFDDTQGIGVAYYSKFSNNITLPYSINLKNEEEKKFFYETILHEVLHESTMSKKGISEVAKERLRDSFKSLENESTDDSIYYSEPCELIVRKQILDLEMEKVGIKKYGDEFKEENYQQLLKLNEEGKLSSNGSLLIKHIKPEDFIKVMNELAESSNTEKKDNYYNPEWNYGNENQA